MVEKIVLEVYDPLLCALFRKRSAFAITPFCYEGVNPLKNKRDENWFEQFVDEKKLSPSWLAFKAKVWSAMRDESIYNWVFRGITKYSWLTLRSIIKKGHDFGLDSSISQGREYTRVATEQKAWEYLEFQYQNPRPSKKGILLVYDSSKLTIPPGDGKSRQPMWNRFVRTPAEGLTFKDALVLVLVISLKH